MIDIRQTLQYANYLSKIGWKVERIDKRNYFIKKFPLIGYFLKIQRPEKVNIEEINNLAKGNRAFQVILEPKNKKQENVLKRNGFKLNRHPYLPTKTLQIDLTKSEKEIFNGSEKDCRYAIKKTNKLKTKEVKILEDFRNFWKNAVGWKRYVPPLNHLMSLKKSFGNNSLFLSTKNGNSGAIFLLAGNNPLRGKKAYYWQAFTNKEGRKALAQYKILWEGILWAKKNNAKIFDFEGIYDERFPDKSWKGFTHFKKSFGGQEVEYPGCFTKTILPYSLKNFINSFSVFD